MPEPENRALFDLDIVRCGHGDVRVTKHPLRRDQAEAGVYLRAEFLPERVQRSPRNDAVCTKPAVEQLDEVRRNLGL